MAQFNVNLAFNADTGKAKAQIQELQSLLNKIAYSGTTSPTKGLQTDLQAASAAAKELQFHLNNAFNASTGNFDLSMLDRSLKTSGSNITDLSTKLLSAGASGQQAFVKLAQSISLADQPMFRISKRMQEFAVTMKNTVKWQLSSSMLHGFMGAVQSAYGYAQDLNKSLNDIRIVTGYNTDRMAEFAEQANKAAKALSTTTTDYTNASLIYFQQGLSDEEVTARTDITVKMANAVGQSAEVISEQLTAVWNNFDDGNKSLEYYADVMTALGAATASSSDEISEGLSKFAAVAGSVGLSYEYATSALATLTSNTRESADVVGNALKTLFARIQGLKLGETLDDGTDLNKYSAALESIGVSIYDTNGGLKDMDNILNEMAAKWDVLNDTQQVALAQTVAGVRQYNQLIALMENWNNGDSDSMMANLSTVKNSQGALQEQADIYAQSWEAASERVQAAAEGIYQSLLDDKFFINLNNGFANLLGGLDAFIEGAGGIKTILIGIGGIIASTFANKIPEALNTFKYNLEIMTKGTQVAYDRIQQKMQEANQIAFTGKDKNGLQVINNPIDENSSMGEAIKQANALTAARNKLALVSDRMSNAEKQAANQSLNFIHSQQEELVALKEKAEALEKNIKLQKQSLRDTKTDRTSMIASQKSAKEISDLVLEYKDTRDSLQEKLEKLQAIPEDKRTDKQSDRLTQVAAELEQYKLLYNEMEKFSNYYNTIVDKTVSDWNVKTSKTLLEQFLGDDFDEKKTIPIEFSEEVKKAFKDVRETMDSGLDFDDSLNLDGIKNKLKAISSTIAEPIREATGLEDAFQKVFRAKNSKELEDSFKDLAKIIDKCGLEGSDLAKTLEKIYGKPISKLVSDMKELENVTKDVNSKASLLSKLLNDFKPTHTVRLSEAFGSLAGMIGNTVTIANSLVSVFKAMANPDLSGWERLSVVFSSIATIIPTTLSSISDFAILKEYWDQIAVGISKAKAELIANNIALAANTKQQQLNEAVALAKLKVDGHQVHTYQKLNTAEIQAAMAAYVNKEATEEVTKAKIADIIASGAQVKGDTSAAAAKIFHTLASEGLTKGTWKLVAAQLGLNTAMLPYIAAVAAVAAVIGAAVLIYDALTTSQEEAQEAIYEAADAVEEEKSKLQDLESELSSVKDKIDELASKGPLTLTEQAELNRLRAIESSLENQVSAQQRLLEIEQQRQALTITQNWGAAYGHLENAKTEGSTEYVAKTYEDTEVGGVKIPGWLLWLGDTMTNAYNAQNGNYQAGTATDATAEQKTFTAEENANNWYAQHGAEFIQAESDYFTLMQAYTSGILDDVTRAQVEATMGEMQAGLRAGRLASVGGDEDAYNDRYLAGIAGSGSFSGLTATDIANGDFDYATMAGKDALAIAGVGATEFNEYMSTQMAKAMEMGFSAEELAALEPEQLQTLLTNLDGLNKEAVDKFRTLGISLGEWIDGTVEGVYQGFNTAKWKNEYKILKDLFSDLETGDTISAADYALLGEEYQRYFTLQADGTAILTGKAKELLATVQRVETEKLANGIERTQGQMYDFQYNTNADGEFVQDRRYISTDSARAAMDIHNEGFTYQDQTLTDYAALVNEQYGTSFDVNSAEGWEQAIAYIEQQNALLEEQQVLLAGSATSQDQLNQYLQQGLITQEQYNQSLAGATIKEAEHYDIDIEELMQYATYLEEIEGMTEELALKAALAQKKQGKAVEDLTDNYKDYAKVLKKAKLDPTIKGTEEYSRAIMSLRKDLSLLTGLSEDVFDEDFLNSSEVQKAMKDVANGVDGAIERLQTLAAMEQLRDIRIEAGLEINEGEFSALTTQIAKLNNMDIEVGTRINDAPALDQLANLVNASGMTAAQMQEFFNALGWEPEIEWVEADADTVANMHSLGYQEYGVLNPDGSMSIHSVPLDGNMSQHSGQKIMIPKIKTAGKGGGYTKIDPPGGSGNSNKSGGGSKKHAEKKDSGDRTRYHTIQNQLEDLQDAYDNISDAADRAFGKDKLDLMDEQSAALDDLIDKQKEYVDTLAKDVPIDKAVMEAYYNKVIGGPGMKFDENGNISNYDDIEAAMHKKYNEMASKYREDSKEWQAFKKQYDQMMKYLEDYEKYYDDLRDAEAEYQDLLNQRIDLELQQVQYSVQLKLDISQDDLNIIEYQFDLLEDKAFASAERITKATEKANNLYNQMLTNRNALEETLGLSLSDAEMAQVMSGDMSVLEGKTFTEDQIDAIKDYRDSLLNLNTELIEVQKQIEEEVMTAFNEWHEQLDEGIDQFNHYSNMLESYQNIIDIVGKDILGLDNMAIAKLSQAQVENAINELGSLREAYESYQKAANEAELNMLESQRQAAEARARGDEETAKSYEEDAEFWKETYDEMNKSAQEAQEALMDGWGNTLESIVSQFEFAVERAVEAFNKAVYGLRGLEGLSDEFSRQKELSDMYLDDYQQIYELSKLSRDINNSIDDTENLGGKQKLKKLLTEINKLQEDGVEMSQYDLEYLQKTYDLRLAEIELEEAQKAKDTVRLSRDNEGNWSYVYTQNTDAVDSAQQKYEDALYAMQDLSSNYIDEMSEQLIATSQEMQEALANVRVEDYASIEEYYAEIARIEAQYNEQLKLQEAELQKAIDNNKILYEEDWMNYSTITGYKIADAENFAQAFSDTLLGSLIGSEETTANFANVIGEATDILVQNLAEAAANYYANLNSAMEAAGTSTSEFADLLAEDIESIKADSEEAADAIAEMAERMDEEMTKITDRVQQWQEDYGHEVDKIIAKNLEIIESFNDMLETLSVDPDQINVTYDIRSNPDSANVPDDTASASTGMYTGEWGKEGRVAILHEKELVLNQNDTTNMLKMLELTRYMISVIDANAKQMSLGVGNLQAASLENHNNEILEQQVSIIAEFPNATNHNEIEEAFNDLINRAAQYANRK